jgi:hypothetical protein
MPHAKIPDVPLLDRLCWSPADFAALTGFSISFIHQKIKEGALRSKKVNGRRIINHRDGQEFIGLDLDRINSVPEISAELAASPSNPTPDLSPHSRRRHNRPSAPPPRLTAA